MERQTGYTVEELIEFCDAKLAMGGHSACGHGHDPFPLCLIVNELGVSALKDDDKKAQTYLTGLLGSGDEMCQLTALCFLIQIDTLMTEDKIKLDEFTAENTQMVAKVLKKIESVDKPDMSVN